MIRRLLEPLVFLSLATAVHAAVWAGWSGSGTASGHERPASNAIAVAGPDMAAMVHDWTLSPSVSTTLPDLSAPVSDAAPVLPAPSQLAPNPRAVSDLPVLTSDVVPQIERAPPPRPVKTPKPRSEPPVVQATPGSDTPRQATQSGPERAKASGQSAISQGQRNSLMAGWASKIRARIDRKRSYPSAARAAGLTGTVTLALEVAADGQVLGVRVAQSSGHAALDHAALAAVARAGRLPRAPKGLGGARHAFRLPLSFRL